CLFWISNANADSARGVNNVDDSQIVSRSVLDRSAATPFQQDMAVSSNRVQYFAVRMSIDDSHGSM
ncbi:MAG TPA: hypothetical protein VFQ43_03905, partial [Nitrososphaera sp.]|nr:hypothetical protein [Nitrososphaera sp.]